MAKASEARVYQIKITLDGTKPPIWRRLLVPGSVTLAKLHDILQIAMGWTDSHLHQFEARGEFYGKPDPEFGAPMKAESRVRLDEVLVRVKDAMIYEYDFGDGWTHKIVLEKILEPAEGIVAPSCIAGARACPPEDCGGIWGYEELLGALGDPSHPEHDEMLEWMGGPFEPEHFDADEINKWLAPRRRR
jgi:pRiA4b ORF-3-like protein